MKSISMFIILVALVGCGKDIADQLSDNREEVGKMLIGSFSTACESESEDLATLTTLTFIDGEHFRMETTTFDDADCTEATRSQITELSGNYTLAHTLKASLDSIIFSYSDVYRVTYFKEADVTEKEKLRLTRINELKTSLEQARQKRDQQVVNKTLNKDGERESSLKIKRLEGQLSAVEALPKLEVGQAQSINRTAAFALNMKDIATRLRGRDIATRLRGRDEATYQVDGNTLLLSGVNDRNLTLTKN